MAEFELTPAAEEPESPSALSSRPHVVMQRLHAARTEINARFLEIAELLTEVHANHYWRELGFASFETFVEETLDMSYRKAMYLADCFHVLIEKLQLSREEVAQIGWTRAKELLPVINEENKAQWVEFAKNHTTNETNLAVRQSKAPPGQAENLKQYSTLTIGMFDHERVQIEEALEYAKREAGTERAATALLLICAEYAAEAKARHAQATGATS